MLSSGHKGYTIILYAFLLRAAIISNVKNKHFMYSVKKVYCFVKLEAP